MKDLSNRRIFVLIIQSGLKLQDFYFNQSLIACVNEGIAVLAIKTWLLNNNKSSRKYFCSSTFYLEEETNFYFHRNSVIIALRDFLLLLFIKSMVVFQSFEHLQRLE